MGRQTAGDGFALELSGPHPSRGRLRHHAALAEALEAAEPGSKAFIACFETPDVLCGEGGFLHGLLHFTLAIKQKYIYFFLMGK